MRWVSNGIIASTWSRNEARYLQCAWLTRDGSCRSLSDSDAQRCDLHWPLISAAQPGLRTGWSFVSVRSRESKARPQICSRALGPLARLFRLPSLQILCDASVLDISPSWRSFFVGASQKRCGVHARPMQSTSTPDVRYKRNRCGVQVEQIARAQKYLPCFAVVYRRLVLRAHVARFRGRCLRIYICISTRICS